MFLTGAIYIYDLRKKAEPTTIRAHDGPVRTLAFSRQRRKVRFDAARGHDGCGPTRSLPSAFARPPCSFFTLSTL
jgi:hypothetical protein